MTNAIAIPLARRIADAVAGIDFDRLTPDRRSRAQRCATDFLGCVVGGGALPELAPAILLAHPGAIEVPGVAGRFDPASAALVMGTAGALLQIHDVFTGAALHPCAPVISAAWAVWRGGNAPRSRFLTGLVAGYEVCNRLGRTVYANQPRVGTAATATMGAIGAAVAASIILGADVATTARAVGNAAFLTPIAPFQTLCDHANLSAIHAGLASRAGVEAAMLALGGWDAGGRVLEGGDQAPGFLTLIGGTIPHLGDEPWSGETLDDIIWKLLPSCFASLLAIEAALMAPAKPGLEIVGGEIRLCSYGLSLVANGPGAAGELYDRLMSVRWGVARALLERRFDLDSATRPAAPDVMALAQRLRVVADPALDSRLPELSAIVTIETSDGHTARMSRRRGKLDLSPDAGTAWVAAPGSPLLDQKFLSLTARVRLDADRLRDEILD